ncbi:hypothetical protein BBP21_06340 [Salmonella enterica subsp. enterica serovar Enteritidis]|nr:hypothetical protein BBP21_06340 [Salmonella enterica subsp. enterica serovar Enteritidis]
MRLAHIHLKFTNGFMNTMGESRQVSVYSKFTWLQELLLMSCALIGIQPQRVGFQRMVSPQAKEGMNNHDHP